MGLKYCTSSETSFNTTAQRPKPRKYTWVEEHVPHRRRLLVHLERMPAQNDSLRYHPSRVGIRERARGDKVRRLHVLCLAEQQARLCAEGDRAIDGSNGSGTVAEVALELVHIVRTLAATAGELAVDGVHAQAAGTDAEDEWIFGPHRAVVLGVALHGEVQHRLLVFMLHKAEDNQGRSGVGVGHILRHVLQEDGYPRSRLPRKV